jgi:hypothetical protein
MYVMVIVHPPSPGFDGFPGFRVVFVNRNNQMNKIKNNVNTNKNKNNKNKTSNKKSKSNSSPSYNDNKLNGIKLVKSVAYKSPLPKGPVVKLSHCAAKYAMAVTDPLNPACRGACIPYGSAPSMKSHAYIRFDLAIGTGGVAIVYLCPSLANDAPSLYYTGPTFAGTNFTSNTPFATAGSATTLATLNTGWAPLYHNGPFTSSQLTVTGTDDVSASAVGRMVSAGLRSQYTGTTLNESGLHWAYHDPSHSSLSGITVSSVGAFGDANIIGVTRRPFTLPVFGVNEKEMTFYISESGGNGGVVEQLYPYANANSNWSSTYGGTTILTPFIELSSISSSTFFNCLGAPVGIYAVTGVPGQTLHIEFQVLMEYTGTAAASMLTPTHADIEGTQMVRTAALQVPTLKISQPTKSPWELMYSALSEVAKAAKPMVIPLLERAVTALLL